MTTFTEPTTETVPVPILPAPAFCIDTDEKADWLLAKLAAYEAESDLLTRQHQAAVNRVETDRKSLLHLYGDQLQAFAAQKVAQDKRGRKSIILPHGTLAFRSVAACIKISDMAAALQSAKQTDMPDMVKVETREVLDTNRYQKAAQLALQTQGVLLAGVAVQEAREAFSIKFGRKEEATD